MDFGFLARRNPSQWVLGLCFCALGAFFSAQGILRLDHAYRLSGPVDKATGSVVSLYKTQSRHGHVSYHVDYSFPAAGSVITSRGAILSYSEWAPLHPGANIRVRYLDGAAAINAPDFADDIDFAIRQGWIRSLMPLFFIGMGCFVVLLPPKRNRYSTGGDRGDRLS